MGSPQDIVGPLQHSRDFELAFRVRQRPATQARACVILLHGVGGSELNLAGLAAGLDSDILVLLPRGRLALGPEQFAWFGVDFTANGPRIVESEAEQSRLALIRFVGQVQAAFGLAPDKTVLAGFSQGGIVSASVALSAPECVAGFGLLSGRILPELEPHLADRTRLTRLRAFIAHGEHDRTLPVVWAQRSDELLRALGVSHQTRLYPIDHAISAAMQADFLAWVRALVL